MRVGFVRIASFALLAFEAWANKTSPIVNPACRDELNLTHVAILRDRARDQTRDQVVSTTLREASGVYVDKERGRKHGLSKTVFITVIAYNAREKIHHYKVYFRNFLCFTKHFGIDLIVYILHHHLPDVAKEIRSLEELGVRVLTYPDERFWNTIYQKKNLIKFGPRFADYDSEIPNFQSHGALVMVVPQLEVLELGYNVIYFDVDIGLVQDPVPFITRGDADFTVSIEQRDCPDTYPSTSRMDTNWGTVEPNTGVMHVRATPQGVAMYRKWLYDIVTTNLRNDQMTFHRDERPTQAEKSYYNTNITSTFTPSCNWDHKNYTPSVRATSSAGTFCFLPEMLFQNGMNAFQCSSKAFYRDNWHEEMVMHVDETVVEGTSLKNRMPVIVHANYCNGKTHELAVRGLWLYNSTNHDVSSSSPQSECQVYKMSDVYFAKKNYTTEMAAVNLTRRAILKATLISGSLVKRLSSDEVFIISAELLRRLIPDGKTFLHMGFEWENVRVIPAAVLFSIPLGKPFDSTSPLPPPPIEK